jgi:hypothetical protein
MSTELELTAGKWVSWQDWSKHANSSAGKAWALRVTDTHEKYGVAGDWLQKQKIDGDIHFDVSDLAPGRIVKVSGASHKNSQNAYWRVESVNGTLDVSEMSEAEVIESLEQTDELDQLRREVQEAAVDADEETLRRVTEIL